MKNWILFIGLGLFTFTASSNAQTCSHGSKTAGAKSCVKPSEAALKAASLDASIETKTCKESGAVCFVKKTKDAQGMVSTSEVRFDEATSQFVSIPEAKASCSKSAKACCAKGAGKACCKSKSTTAVMSPDMAAPDIAAPAEDAKSK